MPGTDMSPAAVTVRLLRTEQLRRLCLALRTRRRPEASADAAADPAAAPAAGPGRRQPSGPW